MVSVWGKKLSDSKPLQRQEGCMYAVRVLSLINLLNFADRNIINAVKMQLMQDLQLTDFQSALPQTGMTLAFMITATIFGELADKQFCDRRYILIGGVVFWSLATGLAGLSQNLIELILFRSLVGVGEAAYGTIAPPMLFDFFPKPDRTIVYASYFLNSIMGAAFGFIIGSILASIFGWRWTFVAFGLPGLIVAFAMGRLNDPPRGINDTEMSPLLLQERDNIVSCKCDAELGASGMNIPSHAGEATGRTSHSDPNNTIPLIDNSVSLPTKSQENSSGIPNDLINGTYSNSVTGQKTVVGLWTMTSGGTVSETAPGNPLPDPMRHTTSSTNGLSPQSTALNEPPVVSESHSVKGEVMQILSNRTFMVAVLGLALNNFAFGGLTEWMTVYLQRYVGSTLAQAGVVVGFGTVVGGILGTVIGTKACKYYDTRWKNAYLLLPAISCFPAAISIFIVVNSSHKGIVFCALCIFLLSMFCVFGPIVTLLMTSVSPHLRSRAIGITIFFQHIFGNLMAPSIIGLISDRTHSLRNGMQLIWLSTLACGFIWAAGAYYLPASLPMELETTTDMTMAMIMATEAEVEMGTQTKATELITVDDGMRNAGTSGGGTGSNTNHDDTGGISRAGRSMTALSFKDIFCGCCPCPCPKIPRAVKIGSECECV